VTDVRIDLHEVLRFAAPIAAAEIVVGVACTTDFTEVAPPAVAK
jgi:hypothetical protein